MKYVRLRTPSGAWMWVNPDRVQFVMGQNDGALLVFDGATDKGRAQGVPVQGTALEVVKMLEGEE